VSAGDTNGDGYANIFIGAGTGRGPHVKVFSGLDASTLQSGFAHAATFTGSVRVGATDWGNNFKADIVTAAGPTGGPHVQVFDGLTLRVRDNFFAYDPKFAGGVFVGAFDSSQFV
jgi:hypothetical protein